MDYLPYDIHEHILSFIDNKTDRFCYVNAYDNLEMWKQYALSLTKNIKNKYYKPRNVIQHDIMKGVTFYLSLDSGHHIKGQRQPLPHQYANFYNYMFCPCGKRYIFKDKELDRAHLLKQKIRSHKNTEKHKKQMINPLEISTGFTDERYHISKHFRYDGPF